ncbi:hypothetical protein GIX45_07090 [Erwinia sp. CPCC 100877]|nr:hypothetical protein [Erwinia sp. CPCC 100877]
MAKSATIIFSYFPVGAGQAHFAFIVIQLHEPAFREKDKNGLWRKAPQSIFPIFRQS